MKLQHVLLLCLMFFASVSFAQKQINQFDNEGKRHGIWKKYHKLNNKLRYSGQFYHGKEVGIFKYYDINNDEKPIVIRKFNKSDDTAEVSFFSTRGVLESKGKMQLKKRIGKWLFYHKDGRTILSEEFYKEGFLEEQVIVYYANKKITEIAHYVKGKLHGNYKRYSQRGFLYQDLTYNNGELNGKAIYYERKNGLILTQGLFKDNKLVGIWEHD